MRQLICRRTCEWLEIGYTYRAVRISYLVHLAEVAHIHTGYCKITTCYRARPDKRAQRVAFSSNSHIAAIAPHSLTTHPQTWVELYLRAKRACYELAGAFLWYIYLYPWVDHLVPRGPPVKRNAQTSDRPVEVQWSI